MFSRQVIKDLLQTSASGRQKLKDTYARLPATQCRRKAHCCSMLPEITLVEALSAIQCLANMPSAVRRGLAQKIIRYFFLNPVEITSCPFLNGRDCLIYMDRFFGCRAYGLWSRAYYEKLAAHNRQAKLHLRKQWESCGVSLPKKVYDFQRPYCLSVEIDGHAEINDKMLLRLSNKIETISKGFARWHQTFGQMYYCDLSFLAAAMVFGTSEAVQMKFRLVSNIVSTGNRTKLDKIIEDLPDLFAKLN